MQKQTYDRQQKQAEWTHTGPKGLCGENLISLPDIPAIIAIEIPDSRSVVAAAITAAVAGGFAPEVLYPQSAIPDECLARR